ncbi:hypothetical protein K491DRAFT_255256 [Lophiostoma macrostomum CBS 122681]|uniref:Uncharacterized protein n=1 Tax=Lophiostoma macrostomum CBS 122681 TaxID=1314788 RepID=A0A6A6SKJ3_9PLEO|nr:hypothetical protein K491DRAFT_255256 [Lophiostoma macrostomum CBS 122681]
MAAMTTFNPPFAPRDIPTKPLSTQGLPSSNPSSPIGGTAPHAVYDAAATAALDAFESLPTISGRESKLFLVEHDIGRFLEQDLDLSRLNVIHGHLWMAGRPMRARPLHRHKMMGFELLPTQQMDLHLLKFSNKVILKPLPEYMLDFEFWQQYIGVKKELHESACGFLVSYIWLITSPIDLRLAHESFLLPSFITWQWWKAFVKDFCNHIDIVTLDDVNQRFIFGELRLGRINSIYRIRFMRSNFVRGYLYGYNRYVVFFQRNFSWILVVFVFFSLVLAAMQVGAAVEPLSKNQAFLNVTYGFVVFSIVSVAAVLGLVGTIFVIIFVFNMGAAILHANRENRNRKKRIEERDHSDKNA